MLTPLDTMRANAQVEFEGFGAVTPHEDERVKKPPLAY
jgi:NADH-quinone oxidoreductase subunit I